MPDDVIDLMSGIPGLDTEPSFFGVGNATSTAPEPQTPRPVVPTTLETNHKFIVHEAWSGTNATQSTLGPKIVPVLGERVLGGTLSSFENVINLQGYAGEKNSVRTLHNAPDVSSSGYNDPRNTGHYENHLGYGESFIKTYVNPHDGKPYVIETIAYGAVDGSARNSASYYSRIIEIPSDPAGKAELIEYLRSKGASDPDTAINKPRRENINGYGDYVEGTYRAGLARDVIEPKLLARSEAMRKNDITIDKGAKDFTTLKPKQESLEIPQDRADIIRAQRTGAPEPESTLDSQRLQPAPEPVATPEPAAKTQSALFDPTQNHVVMAAPNSAELPPPTRTPAPSAPASDVTVAPIQPAQQQADAVKPAPAPAVSPAPAATPIAPTAAAAAPVTTPQKAPEPRQPVISAAEIEATKTRASDAETKLAEQRKAFDKARAAYADVIVDGVAQPSVRANYNISGAPEKDTMVKQWQGQIAGQLTTQPQDYQDRFKDAQAEFNKAGRELFGDAWNRAKNDLPLVGTVTEKQILAHADKGKGVAGEMIAARQELRTQEVTIATAERADKAEIKALDGEIKDLGKQLKDAERATSTESQKQAAASKIEYENAKIELEAAKKERSQLIGVKDLDSPEVKAQDARIAELEKTMTAAKAIDDKFQEAGKQKAALQEQIAQKQTERDNITDSRKVAAVAEVSPSETPPVASKPAPQPEAPKPSSRDIAAKAFQSDDVKVVQREGRAYFRLEDNAQTRAALKELGFEGVTRVGDAKGSKFTEVEITQANYEKFGPSIQEKLQAKSIRPSEAPTPTPRREEKQTLPDITSDSASQTPLERENEARKAMKDAEKRLIEANEKLAPAEKVRDAAHEELLKAQRSGNAEAIEQATLSRDNAQKEVDKVRSERNNALEAHEKATITHAEVTNPKPSGPLPMQTGENHATHPEATKSHSLNDLPTQTGTNHATHATTPDSHLAKGGKLSMHGVGVGMGIKGIHEKLTQGEPINGVQGVGIVADATGVVADSAGLLAKSAKAVKHLGVVGTVATSVSAIVDVTTAFNSGKDRGEALALAADKGLDLGIDAVANYFSFGMAGSSASMLKQNAWDKANGREATYSALDIAKGTTAGAVLDLASTVGSSTGEKLGNAFYGNETRETMQGSMNAEDVAAKTKIATKETVQKELINDPQFKHLKEHLEKHPELKLDHSSPQALQASVDKVVASMKKEADENKPGWFSGNKEKYENAMAARQEMISYLEVRNSQEARDKQQATAAAVAIFDKDGDGRITKAEVEAVAAASPDKKATLAAIWDKAAAADPELARLGNIVAFNTSTVNVGVQAPAEARGR